MASTAYDVSVRKALNNKGIDNSRIGYNNGYTTIDGQNFLKADKLYNGTGFTNQTNFNTAFNSYSAASKPSITAVAGTVRPTVTAPRTSTTNAATTGGTGFTAPKAPLTPATAPMPGSVQIRPALEASGINPNAIGYNNATRSVTVNGQPFTTPSQSINGTTYATPSQYQGALNNQRVGDFQNQLANYKQAENPYTGQLNDTIAYLMDFAKNQQVNDPYSTPEYAAYAAQSGRRAQQGVRAAQESFGGAGFGRSTALGERAQGIQNGETEYLETQVIPTILAAERERYQQQYGNVANLLNPLAGQQQFQAADEQNRLANIYNSLSYFTNENQRAQDNSRADASITGNYQTPEQAELYNTLLGLKQQAEAKGITKDQRSVLSAQADQVRSRLQSLGVDISALGSGSKSAAAAKASPFRTLAGQQVDLQGRQANLDAALNVANMTGRVVNPQSDWTGLFRQANSGKAPLTMAGQNQQFQQGMQNRQQNFTEDSFMKEFNERVRSTGVQEALAWAAQNFQEYSYDRSQTETENQNAISNDQWSQTMAYQQVRDQVGDSQWQAQFDEDTRRYGLDYALNQLVTNNQISQSQADSARSDAQLELQQDQFSYGMASDQDAKSQGQTADAYAPYIESVAKYNETVDKLGQPTGQKTLGNPDTVKRSILASGLNDYEQYRLMEMYGLWPSGEPIPPKPKASTNTTLGNLAKKYESSGNPSTIARNAGDIGGASYGTYQITEGTMPGFVSYLKNSGNPLSGLLSGVQIASKAFDSAWKNAAAQNGGSVLKAAEEGFIKQSHFDPAASSIKSKTGVDLTKRSNAVQQVLWSVSVQHGPGGAKNIFSRAGINNKMTDRQIIDAVYKERSANNGMKYFPSSGQNVRNSVLRRFEKEYQDAVKML